MAEVTGGRVAILDLEGRVLTDVGTARGKARRLAFTVNGEPAGLVLLAGVDDRAEAVVTSALETLERLAEVRNSLADLVRTTAHQWRELSLLYKFGETLSGSLDPGVLAGHLADKAHDVLRGQSTAVCFQPTEPGKGVDCRVAGEHQLSAEEIARWGMGLEAGIILASAEELERVAGLGLGAAGPMMVIPLRARTKNRGVLVVIRSEEEAGFTAEDLKLGSLLAHQTALAFANLELIAQVRKTERLRRELEMAAEIQASILPSPVTAVGPWTVVASCTPAQEVGGDAYMVVSLNDGLLAGVADVSGHGLSSALLMNAFASEIQALCLTESHPGALLEATNRLIGQRVGDMSLFVTVVLARHWDDGRISLANAGHPPAMLLTRDGKLEVPDGSGIPLGVLDGEEYEETVLEADRYNALVLYSDGLTEARNRAGDMYGLDRLKDLLARLAAGCPGPQEVHRAILDDLRSFAGDLAQKDDLTVLVVGRAA